MRLAKNVLGSARRVQVRMPLGARCEAWDCRPFGFGRIIAPMLPTVMELAPGTHLDLFTGELRRTRGTQTIAA